MILMHRNIVPNSDQNRLADYAVNIVGKTLTVIQTPDVKVGDYLINFQRHIGYEVPSKVKKIRKVTKEFYDIEFEGKECESSLMNRFAYSCLFGRVIE